MFGDKGQSIKSGKNSTNFQAGGDITYIEGAPKELIDEKIEERLLVIRKKRFFGEYNRVVEALSLGNQVKNGDYSHGSDEVRSQALAWCARLLARSDEHVEEAQEYLDLAESIRDCVEILIAKAFLLSQRNFRKDALQTLSNVDLPETRTAAFMIVAFHDDAEKSIEWMERVGLKVQDLDSDGKLFYLSQLIDLGMWDEALEGKKCLEREDLELVPALMHPVGVIHLMQAVPDEFRERICHQVPFELREFPLASDESSLIHRCEAQKYFSMAFDIETHLSCPNAAIIDKEFAIWLEILNPETAASGKQHLVSQFVDIKSAIRFINFGLQFSLKLDFDAVKREIDRQIALNGGSTPEIAFALFCLAFKESTPANVAHYIESHFEEMNQFVATYTLRDIQIKMLVMSGNLDKASECIKEFENANVFSESEVTKLNGVISESKGGASVELKKKKFEKSDGLPELIILVEDLERRQEWKDLATYSHILFERTRNLSHAETYIDALMNSDQSDIALAFLSQKEYFLKQSSILQLSYCWALYLEGEIVEAGTRLENIDPNFRGANFRALEANVRVSTGEWGLLSDIVTNEYKEKDNRSAQELLQTAKLALHIKAPLGRDLLYEAANKANGDPEILAAAHFFAVSAGFEGDERVGEWLKTAAFNSDDEGPIQIKSLDDIIALKPEWDEQEAKTWENVSSGQVPIFVAAELLRRTTLELMLFPAFSNNRENILNRKSLIPAFGGNRQRFDIDLTKSKVGVDSTCLITLGYLDMLERFLDAFDTVYIPHTILLWLFDEKTRAEFHQPSRIVDAHKIRDYLARDVVEKFSQSAVVNPELSLIVGEDLALLLEESKRLNLDLNIQCVVVRPSPVYVVSSLMKEEASLDNYSEHLSSCQSVVEKMVEKGVLTAEEYKKAHSYLIIQEKPWPDQPEICDGAILILEDLAITYFMRLGILEKIKEAGFSKVVIAPRELQEANALITYEKTSKDVLEVVERIRSSIYQGVVSGKLKFSKRRVSSSDNHNLLKEDPMMGAIASAEVCDYIITDDRFLNKFSLIGEEGLQAETITTLDLLYSLTQSSVISTDEYLGCKTLLRRSGYCFIPIEETELYDQISNCRISREKVTPSAELKAIADSLLRVRMGDWLQLPQEANWLQNQFLAVVGAMKRMWVESSDIESTILKSNWLLDLFDIRGWAHRLLIQDAKEVNYIQGPHIASILTPPASMDNEKRKEYWGWTQKVILQPLKQDDPKLYTWLVNQSLRHVEWVVKEFLEEDSVERITASTLVWHLLDTTFPPLIRESLLEKEGFTSQFELNLDVRVSFAEIGISLSRANLFGAIRERLNGKSPKPILDSNGREWFVNSQVSDDSSSQLVLFDGNVTLLLPDSSALSTDASLRISMHTKRCLDVNIPGPDSGVWSGMLSQRGLCDEEFSDYVQDFQATPAAFVRSITKEIEENRGSGNIVDFVPDNRKYYDRLASPYDGSKKVDDFICGSLKSFISSLIAWNPYEGFLYSLLLTSHPLVADALDVSPVSEEDLVKAYRYIEDYGDSLSVVGAIELGLRILPERPYIKEILLRLIAAIREDDIGDKKSNIKNLTGLFVMVDGELSRLSILDDVPPFYRRLVSFSQAALIFRNLSEHGVKNMLHDWAMENRGMRFYWQALIDSREEPRWLPDMIDPQQMQQEFFGRILNACSKYRDKYGDKLYEQVVGAECRSILKKCEALLPYYPGPLEGGGVHPNIPPSNLSQAINRQLNPGGATNYSFVAIVNSAKIFRLDQEHIELVSKALRLMRYRLSDVKDGNELISLLTGLAHIAAVNRNVNLANEVRVLTRVSRKDGGFKVSVFDSLRICLIAAASNSELKDWGAFISDWFLEVAYDDLDNEEINQAYNYLASILDIFPALWVSCAKAEAVLKSRRPS